MPPGRLRQGSPRTYCVPRALALAWGLSVALPVRTAGQGGGAPSPAPALLGAQFTLIAQYLPPFPAPYNGTYSLTNRGDFQGTHTYGVYFGSHLAPHVEAYLDIEMARGGAIGNAFGLGGITNGDVIRQGSVELKPVPYVARGYVRVVLPLAQTLDTQPRGMDQLPGAEPAERVEVKLGKLALTDDFDQNRYANTTREQFCNWGLFNNTAWDYAADTRGYSYGVVLAWVHSAWALRLSSMLMPTFANGNVFDWNVRRAHGDNAELVLRPKPGGTVLRLLAYQNHARMGIYAEALALATPPGQPPNIVADDRQGRRKYGFGLNVEQPLADSGETGAFLRLGWNDGHSEDFVFTEVDRHVSAGVQLTGTSWGRASDRLGVAAVRHGLSADHRAYLAAGGVGFLLGDGRLTYAAETILEGYYRVQLGPYVQGGPDVQFVANPGYNHDRGPATVVSLRLHLRY
ncbi:MAG TPA: carbohydrate porin [Gemmatimonadales bacterium]|nr:carbohydrate porin [Gemmatimonadales bacterium]